MSPSCWPHMLLVFLALAIILLIAWTLITRDREDQENLDYFDRGAFLLVGLLVLAVLSMASFLSVVFWHLVC
jgi:hypothetical protein